MEALCQWFYVKNMLLYTHTCPVTEFAVASHLNTANSCCHHVFLRHFRFQKCLPVYSNKNITVPACVPGNLIWTYTQICGKVMDSDNVKKKVRGNAEKRNRYKETRIMGQFIVLDLEWNQSPAGKEGSMNRLPFEIIEIGAVN